MGATNFQTYAFGKTLGEAFRSAQSDAMYWNGHGGYTGTIAEKPGAQLIILPPRVTAKRFLDWLYWYEEASYAEYEREELAELERTRAPRGQAKQHAKRKADLRKAIKAAERSLKRIPVEHRALVAEAHNIYDRKWDEALAFEITGSEATKIKAQLGKKGTRLRCFCFCGMASC
jgi:hypothetical protein